MDIHRPDQQGFIPFIHNYCDRRCERCRFVRQCRVGIIDVDDVDEDRTGVAEECVEDYAERLRKVMGLPAPEEEGEEEADAEGGNWSVDLDAGEGTDPDLEARRQAIQGTVKAHPFTDLSLVYSDMVSDWFEPREEVLLAMGATLHLNAALTVPAALRTPDAIMLSEALEEALWFQHMLYVKGQRALTGRLEDQDDGVDLDPLQSDWNGTAKLLLHIVERSIAAWKEVIDRWPDEAASVAPLIAHLEACDVLARQEFPEAHRFIRPGFDAP